MGSRIEVIDHFFDGKHCYDTRAPLILSSNYLDASFERTKFLWIVKAKDDSQSDATSLNRDSPLVKA